MEIKDRVVVVTGAARGIGRATAMAFGAAGARAVVLVDVREPELKAAAEEVRETGAETLGRIADISDLESLRTLFAAVEAQFGRIDVLHNNAGIGEGPPAWPNLDPARSAAIVDVNLRGVVLGTQLVLGPMQRGGGGVVINTASGGAFIPLPPQAVYVATKAGVVHFTRSCVPLQASHGVRVNCVCPGVVETPMLRETGIDGVADWLQPLVDAIEVLRPEQIAEAVLALVRDDSKVGEVVTIENAPAA
jgi:NAD(P)-dependent dehydrogenase (short-subunit alcohol dehydrogenase family)